MKHIDVNSTREGAIEETHKGKQQWVRVESILRDPDNQVRRAIDYALVRQYATAYENDAPFPPIRLAQVNAGLVLIDGWHRLAAQEALGHASALATVEEVQDYRDVKWLAAQANLAHGKRLNRREMRTVFQAFVRARKHRKGTSAGAGYRFKSYREIAAEMGGAVAHTTVRNWMRSDFAKTFSRMGGHSEGGGGAWDKGSDDDGGGGTRQLVAVAARQLAATLATFRAMVSPDDRAAVVEQTRDLLRELEGDAGGCLELEPSAFADRFASWQRRQSDVL